MFHIFIVDDNVADSSLLLVALKRAHRDACVYTISDSRILPAYLDTKSPVESLRGGIHPQILVLQMDMPHYSGPETLAWIRGQSRFDSTFVVMLGSRDNPGERESMKAAGADAYHVKHPGRFDMANLAREIFGEYAAHNEMVVETVGGSAPHFSTAI